MSTCSCREGGYSENLDQSTEGRNKSGLKLREQSDYCTLELGDAVHFMTWEQIDQETGCIIAELRRSKQNDVIVLATSLQSLSEGVMASLVWTWKSLSNETRHLLSVNDHVRIRSDLSSSGLLEHWKIVPTLEDAEKYLRHHRKQSIAAAAGSASSTAPSAIQKSSAPVSCFRIEKHSRYTAMVVAPGLAELAYSEQEAAERRSERATRRVRWLICLKVIYSNSGMIAGLVRFLKVTQAKEGSLRS